MTDAPKLRPSVPPEAATRHFDPILRPDLAGLYTARAARLRHLAEGHELADYLRLAASVADAQGRVVADMVVDAQPDPVALAGSGRWPEILDAIIADLRAVAPADLLSGLASLSDADRRAAALALVEWRFEDVDAAFAPFLWAALSVETALAARAADLPPGSGAEPADCPICGSAPVASLIHTGDRQGLRYLRCSLCECEWHMVRAKCSNCGDAGQLDYLSFDSPEAPIRAEACGACGGYLKVISQERDPAAEVVADDLATLALDAAATAESLSRTGPNPFALPSGEGSRFRTQ